MDFGRPERRLKLSKTLQELENIRGLYIKIRTRTQDSFFTKFKTSIKEAYEWGPENLISQTKVFSYLPNVGRLVKVWRISRSPKDKKEVSF